jgi:hypothetical protein
MVNKRSMTEVEFLNKVIERLKTRGWRSDGGGDIKGDGPLCFLNTVDNISGCWDPDPDRASANRRIMTDERGRIDKRVVELVREVTNHQSLINWNDSQTSVEPIIAACERAKLLLGRRVNGPNYCLVSEAPP